MIAGELLGFDEYIPAFLVATNSQISKGVNYGSGAAGIRDETGSHLVKETCFSFLETGSLPLKFSSLFFLLILEFNP